MSSIYYKPQEIADRWGIGYSSVLAMIRSGKLHAFRAGREWRVSEEALHDYETRPLVPAASSRGRRTDVIKIV